MFPKDTRFLIVDDSAPIRQMMRGALEQIHFNMIDEAENGEQGLELLQKSVDEDSPYGLVLCDINMPKMNGLDLIEKCHVDDKLQKIPFIVITTESSREIVLKAVLKGVKGYLVKPFTINEVQEKIVKAYEILYQ